MLKGNTLGPFSRRLRLNSFGIVKKKQKSVLDSSECCVLGFELSWDSWVLSELE